MGDPLAPNITPQPAQVPSQPVQPVDVDILTSVLLNVPENFENLQRPVQINGTLLGMLENGRLALRTAAGTINLSLESIQNFPLSTLKDQLQPFVDTSKPLMLVIEAGAPPKQAHLLLPKTIEPLKTANQSPLPVQSESKTNAISFSKGQQLSLTHLPEGIDEAYMAPSGQTKISAFQEPQPFHKLFECVQNKFEFLTEALAARVKTEAALQILPDTPEEKQVQQTARVPQHGQVKIEAFLPPDADWPTTLTAQDIKGVVIGKTLSGHLVVESNTDRFFVKQAGNLPTGTKIILQGLPASAAEAYALPLPDEMEWASMRQMVTALQQADPQLGAAFLKTRLPSPAQYLSGTAIFLLSALQTGHIDQWLGPTIKTTIDKSGHKATLEKAVGELSDILQTLATDARVGEWKTYPLPLHFGQAFEMLRLHIHEDSSQKQNTSDHNKIKKTRFIITMNMNRLGAMQLDGLSRPKQLDIVIRSEKPLPNSLPHELREHYIKTLEALGMAGTIVFQTGRQNWIVLEEAGAAPTSHDI